MKLGVMIIWTISEKKFCCHSKLPGGIQIVWPLFRYLSIDFIRQIPTLFLWGILGKHIDRYINAVADRLISYYFY